MWNQESYPPAADLHSCYYFNYLEFKKTFFLPAVPTRMLAPCLIGLAWATCPTSVVVPASVIVVRTMDYADWSALGHMISPEAGSWAQSHPNHTDKDWR